MKINLRYLEIVCCLQIVCLLFSTGIAQGETNDFFQLEKQIATNSWSIGLSNNENELFVADGINNKILVYDLEGEPDGYWYLFNRHTGTVVYAAPDPNALAELPPDDGWIASVDRCTVCAPPVSIIRFLAKT